jgi:FMN phosphatase YigB (HAD superfamily)
VLAALDCAAAEYLLVDDNLANVEPAESAGVKGIRFKSVDGLKEELVERGINI